MDSSDRSHIIVLAAGRGTRMGGPKALMDVGGRPWWQLQVEVLHPVGLPVIWVVSQEVSDALAFSGSPSQRERVGGRASSNGRQPPLVLADPDAPMFASISRGIASIVSGSSGPPGRGIFILPVDVPAPHAKVWHQLDGADQPTAPEYNGRTGHPVYLPWDWVRENILANPAKDQRLDQLMKPDLRAIPVNEPAVIVNLNTPADVQEWVNNRAAGRVQS